MGEGLSRGAGSAAGAGRAGEPVLATAIGTEALRTAGELDRGSQKKKTMERGCRAAAANLRRTAAGSFADRQGRVSGGCEGPLSVALPCKLFQVGGHI